MTKVREPKNCVAAIDILLQKAKRGISYRRCKLIYCSKTDNFLCR